MKKLLIVVLLSMMYIFASAQKYEDAVKFLPINVHYNSASVEWEHQEGKNSLVVGIGIPYWQSIVGRSYGQLTLNSTDFKSASLYTYTIRVAYRHYFSDTPMEGIYLEGYAKSQTLDWCAEINNNQNKMAAGSITGYFYSVSPGVQLGYQYIIDKHFLIDLYMLGVEVCNTNGNAESFSMTTADRDYTIDFVNNLATQYLPKNAQSKYSVLRYGNSAKYRLQGFAYPWFRCGISIGYKF